MDPEEEKNEKVVYLIYCLHWLLPASEQRYSKSLSLLMGVGGLYSCLTAYSTLLLRYINSFGDCGRGEDL